MSFAAQKIAITTAFQTLPTLAAGYEVYWPNAALPSGTGVIDRFVVVDVIWGGTDRADIGTPGNSARQRTFGIVQVAIYNQLGIGENASLTLADQIAALVRHTSVTSGVVFRTPSIASRGRVNDGRHWRVDVEIPFYGDATS